MSRQGKQERQSAGDVGHVFQYLFYQYSTALNTSDIFSVSTGTESFVLRPRCILVGKVASLMVVASDNKSFTLLSVWV